MSGGGGFDIRHLRSDYIIHTNRSVTILHYLNFFPELLGGCKDTKWREPWSMLLQQPGTVLKLPLISFLGIQSRLLRKMWLSVSLTHTHTHTHRQSQGFSCGRYSHSARFIHGRLAALDCQVHHVNASPCNLPHLARVCAKALSGLKVDFLRLLWCEKWGLEEIRIEIRNDTTIARQFARVAAALMSCRTRIGCAFFPYRHRFVFTSKNAKEINK